MAADDQGGARFVDEDVVDLVDDRIGVITLYPLNRVSNHVVPQIIESKLVVGAVGYFCSIGVWPTAGGQGLVCGVLCLGARVEQIGPVVLQNAHLETQQVVNRPHPLGVAPR